MHEALAAGNVAVVTGAGDGMGRAIAIRLAETGLRIVVLDIDQGRIDATLGLLSGDGHVGRAVDVREAEQLSALADEVSSEIGPVCVLCNNAGIVAELPGPVWEQPLEGWQNVLSVNLFGVLHGIRAFVPRMIEHGRPSHVVNTASMAGLTTSSFVPSYGVSKHGVVALSDALRLQLAERGLPIGVSVLCPGPVSTNLIANSRRLVAGDTDADTDADTPDDVSNLSPAPGSVVTPEHVADCVVRGIRDDAPYVFPSSNARERVTARFDDLARWL